MQLLEITTVSSPPVSDKQRFLNSRKLFERIRNRDSIFWGKGIENVFFPMQEGGGGGRGLLGASPSKALTIRLLMGCRMCLEVSMTTLLNARDIP